jgi:hypothetical protein
VLILTDADRFRLDPDQLGERILQAAGDGDRSPQRDVNAREIRRRPSSDAE